LPTIEIITSQDKFEARISIIAETADYPSVDQIKKKLAENGIIYGIDDEIITLISNEKKPVQYAIVARGNVPVHGENAELIWAIETDFSAKPAITETDRADFKQIKLFERIKKDQALVSKLPVSEGKPGINVFGETVLVEGIDLEFPAGKNTWIAKDGLTLYSAIDGFAYWENDLLNIDNIYQIQGNVDYHTGNIRANGTVIIEGDVRSGFRVEATESIIIGGNVEAASLYSQNGDITVKCGILGGGRAKILSGGNLSCGFIQDATVSVKKNIVIDRYAINSTISAGGTITLENNVGLIRGGDMSSGNGITAVEVGSKQNIYTELNVRLHSEDQKISMFLDVERKRKEAQREVEFLKRRLAFINLLKNRIDGLSDEKFEELKMIESELEFNQRKLAKLESKEAQITKESSESIHTNEIKILKNLHSNVKINIGNLEFFSHKLYKQIRIFQLNEELVVESLADPNSPDYEVYIPN